MDAKAISIDYLNIELDVSIRTSGGSRIQAHSIILASGSPVLEHMIKRAHKGQGEEKIIKIQGVPCDAVTAFVNFIYSSRCGEDDMDKYGMHLLVLSHAYGVPKLKQRCVKGLTQRLTVENVVDVLQLANLCDAPDLYLSCIQLLTNRFKAVEKTQGWKFLTDNDPWLELHILNFMDEHERRKEKWRRRKEEQVLYAQLSEAMECLEHICREGCTNVGPQQTVKNEKKKKPCTKFSTCEGLQLLIRHFGRCKKRINGGCLRCKQMWQLFRLHSYICQHTDSSCKVPLCRQFQLRMQQEKRKDDPTWKVLAKKVASAKLFSSLSLLKRNRYHEIKLTINSVLGSRVLNYN